MEPEELAVGPSRKIQKSLAETFSSLAHRNYRLYFIGQMVSNTGNWLTNVALTLLVLALTHSGVVVGLLAACQYGPILVFSAWGGAVADRVDKRKFLLLTQSLEMMQSAALAVFAFMPHPPLVWLFVVATMGGMFLAFDNPLRRSFVSEMVPEKDVPNAVVLYSTIVNLSRVFGPSLAGLLVVTLGYGWCFTVDAVSYLAVIACLLLMRARELYVHPPAPRKKGEIRAGVRYVFSEPRLWIAFVMLAVIGTLSYNFGVTLPLFVAKGLHDTNTTYTILFSVMGVGSVVAALIVAHRRLVKIRHAILGAAAMGAAVLVLATTQNVVAAAAVTFFVGMSSIIYSTSTTAMVQIVAKPNMRGRVLALQTVLLMGTTPIGGPLLGWAADAWGGRMPLVIGGLAGLAAAGAGYYFSREHIQKARPLQLTPQPSVQSSDA